MTATTLRGKPGTEAGLETAPPPRGARLPDNIRPFDTVRFWRSIRRTPDGPTEIRDEGIGHVGAMRQVVLRRDSVTVARVITADRKRPVYVPLDSLSWHDPDQIAMEFA